nr:MAG TPA: hypothetical protein [Caudoviricetes sp.]
MLRTIPVEIIFLTSCNTFRRVGPKNGAQADGFKPYDLIIRLIGSVVNIWQSKKPGFCVYF